MVEVGVGKSPVVIVIDKHNIVWYGLFVLEGDLQKSPSSFSLRVLLFSSARSSSWSVTSWKVSNNKRLNCNCVSDTARLPADVCEETLT